MHNPSGRILVAFDASVIGNVMPLVADGRTKHDAVRFIDSLIRKVVDSNGCFLFYSRNSSHWRHNEYLIKEYKEPLQNLISKFKSYEAKFGKIKISGIASEQNLEDLTVDGLRDILLKILIEIYRHAFQRYNFKKRNINIHICFLSINDVYINNTKKVFDYVASDNDNCCKICLDTLNNMDTVNMSVVVSSESRDRIKAVINCLNERFEEFARVGENRCLEDVHILLTPLANTKCLDSYDQGFCSLDYSRDGRCGRSVCLWAITSGSCKRGDFVCFGNQASRANGGIYFTCNAASVPISVRVGGGNSTRILCFGIIYLCDPRSARTN